MSVFEMIGAVLIGPLKLLFELIFSFTYSMIPRPGLVIIVLSLAMNILVLPLYRRADDIQIAARDTENKLKDVATHIKKTFSGDERMMILQTYYRQNHYNPLSVLSGSLSLMLEIPFFMAAYQFLSGVALLEGAAFGPIADLSKPDGLLNIGGMTVNLLPVLMTVINVVSSSLYLKGFPLKTKIQLYAMALFFLVFLYNSPAALVFYWTLNNTFSLFKTLFYRIKNSRTILNVILSIAGVGFFAIGVGITGYWKTTLFIGLGLVAQLPWALPLLKKLPFRKGEVKPANPNTALFVLGALFLTVLVGLLIPSAYISASPQEYINISYFYNPVWYVVNTCCVAAGTFLVWLGVFYWLATPKGKVIFSNLVWVLCGIMLVNYMFFGTKLGVVSPNLFYAEGVVFSGTERLINTAVVLALAVALYLIYKKIPRGLTAALLIGTIALASMGIVNVVAISNASNETKEQLSSSYERFPAFSLSKKGKNVVVIMLDRGIGPFVPYLMEENPALRQQFDGFTYYSNTLSYGAFTNFTTPALFGGYEYTPVNLNLRDQERMADKHNEALMVMPKLFAEAGYEVSVIDPSYAGYKWIPDISVYDNMDGVTAYLADGRFDDVQNCIKVVNTRKRNFFLFSIMKTLPVALQSAVYNDGLYYALPSDEPVDDTSEVYAGFMNAYNVLKNMDSITEITNDSEDTFMTIRSNLTHEPVILQEPFYTPANKVDNSAYYPAEGKTITAGDSSYLLSAEYMISHYHTNMSALILLGNWFDYLRQNDVYDNTRIIVVSDHGRNLGVFDQDEDFMHDIEFYLPMLMVKDFDAEGFSSCDDYMTNADVPSLAMDGVIQDPVNPFTGNKINTDAKSETPWVLVSQNFEVGSNNGYQFLADQWATVSGNVHLKENWTFQTEKTVLPIGLQ